METRFTDIDSVNSQATIDDYILFDLVSLERAIRPLINLMGEIEIHANTAKLAIREIVLEDELTHDEAAAIYLYSMETGLRSVYRMLNSALRTNIRAKLQPWFPYLKLIHTAFNKLPSHQEKLWRGVGKDISASYRKGMCIVWHSISSCSKEASVVETFLNKKVHSTLVSVVCKNGKSISKYSQFPHEYEIILMPGTQLKVTSKPFEHNGLHIVDLEELPNCNVQRKYAILPTIKNDQLSSVTHEKGASPSSTQKKSASSSVSTVRTNRNPGKRE